MTRIPIRSRLIAFASIVWILVASPAIACTRCMRVFAAGTIVVAGSMDWSADPDLAVWIFPRGTKLVPLLPSGDHGVGHLAISDPSGDSAIFETIDGRLSIHHGRNYAVMTNSPPFDDQLRLNPSWKRIGGAVMLPWTIRADDRFVAASHSIDAIPHDLFRAQTIASVFSVIRNVSAQLGITTPDEPNVASTIWRTVHHYNEHVVSFDSATRPTVFWVPLEQCDLAGRSPVKRLALSHGET